MQNKWLTLEFQHGVVMFGSMWYFVIYSSIQAIIFGIITNKKFDMIVMAFIGLNMVSLLSVILHIS